ncbi:MAG TPA: gluconate 2-dehydrogenase subunit 3 family protein [Phototrophicaceae bacterium]|nr:gluconate 2-dehydrogenase subunit 3 family protein [Phototrophicaceae bacterium]
MLTPRQLQLLQTLVNRIIPADDDPGGWEGGVGAYLARQFEGDLKAMLPIYALGLDALDRESHAVYNAPFDRLPTTVQDELLARIEAGKITTAWPIDPVLWFRRVVDHCAEGYYSDPANGGNLDAVSWQMIGFEVRE